MLFELIDEEILNSLAIKYKAQDLKDRLRNKRTPKKFIEPLREEIARLEALYVERKASEKPRI